MEDVARQILGYFVRNPNTVDTLDGIARWRLLEAMVRQSVEDTAKGVQVLVQQGFLDEEEVPGMAPLFRLNPEKREEAEKALTAGDLPWSNENGVVREPVHNSESPAGPTEPKLAPPKTPPKTPTQ